MPLNFCGKNVSILESYSGEDFSHQNLDMLSAYGLTIENVSFKGSSLRHAGFTLSTLINVDFTDADLRDAWLNDTELDGCIFTNADLRGAKLEMSNITPEQLRSARTDETTRLHC